MTSKITNKYSPEVRARAVQHGLSHDQRQIVLAATMGLFCGRHGLTSPQS